MSLLVYPHTCSFDINSLSIFKSMVNVHLDDGNLSSDCCLLYGRHSFNFELDLGTILKLYDSITKVKEIVINIICYIHVHFNVANIASLICFWNISVTRLHCYMLAF